MKHISPNFTYEELTITHVRLDNTPGVIELRNMEEKLGPGLELVKTALNGLPILVNSGYRSVEVNEKIGGSKTSAHCLGYAADFICPKFGTPIMVAQKLKKELKNFDQMIYEGTWIHVSFDPRNRKQILTKTDDGYKEGIG